MPDDFPRRAIRGFAKHMRAVPTPAERKLWLILRARRFSGFKFKRQVPLGPYIADFVCFERRLIVEADGSQHAESTHDLVRDAWFQAQGFRVRRFWNADILMRPARWRIRCGTISPAGVADQDRATPHPALRATFSRKGRRG